jgi:hypothetical protein
MHSMQLQDWLHGGVATAAPRSSSCRVDAIVAQLVGRWQGTCCWIAAIVRFCACFSSRRRRRSRQHPVFECSWAVGSVRMRCYGRTLDRAAGNASSLESVVANCVIVAPISFFLRRRLHLVRQKLGEQGFMTAMW